MQARTDLEQKIERVRIQPADRREPCESNHRQIAGNGACPYCDCHAFIPSPGDDTRCGRSNCGHRWFDHY